MELKSSAFHLSVYDRAFGIYGILLEANAMGKIHVSGRYHPNPKTEIFYNQIIDRPGLINDFHLLEVPDTFRSAIQINQSPETQEKIAEGDRLSWQSNLDWTSIHELERGHTERIDMAFGETMHNSFVWHCGITDLIYRHPKKLSLLQCNLLYFCPPANYQTPAPYRDTKTIKDVVREEFS